MVVLLNGPKGDAFLVTLDLQDSIGVKVVPLVNDRLGEEGAVRISHFDWIDGEPLARAQFIGDDEEQTPIGFLQYEGRGTESYKLKYNGSQQEVIVRTKEEHELSRHMRAPEVKDYSRFLLCPMPGTLVKSMSKFIFFHCSL